MANLPQSFGHSPNGDANNEDPSDVVRDVRQSFGKTGIPDDPWAEMENAFGYDTESDELTDREIEALYIEEMERRDRDCHTGNPHDPNTSENRNGSTGPVAIRPGHFSRSSDDEVLALLQAVTQDHTELIDRGYTDTPDKKRLFLCELVKEIATRIGVQKSSGDRIAQ